MRPAVLVTCDANRVLARGPARFDRARVSGAMGALVSLLLAVWSCAEGGVPAAREAGSAASAMDSGDATSLDAGAESSDAEATFSDADALPSQSNDASFTMGSVPEARRTLCARPADDAVRDIFCQGDAAGVTGLRELLQQLRIQALRPEVDEASAAKVEVDPFAVISTAVFLGLSTALSGQLVSPINPRAILFNSDTFVAFQRGAQKVEIITKDRATDGLNLYLVSFKQACNEAPRGCLPGDLFTLNVERDWTFLTLEDDEDLKNTPSDCRLCHQRGAREPTLLMRELRGPWTHFFAATTTYEGDAGYQFSGGELVSDYLLAKGSESYAGLPAVLLAHTAGGILQFRVNNVQPLEFAPAIELELTASGAPGTARRSATWDQAYAAFKRGEQLPLPHFEPRAVDVKKQAALSEAYARYRRGELLRDALPDLSDIFPDDAQVRAEIGLATEPAATPSETLIQACGACHNDVLDQSISRALFNIALGRMSRAELDLAIARIELPSKEPSAMPPAGMRQIEPEAKKRLIEYLKQSQRPAVDDAQLEAAAKAGMAKPRAGYPQL
jgi:hypothetical protein